MQLDLPPFTLILASTKPESFSGPLVQRFPLHIHLDYYSVSELEQIVEGMTQRMRFEFDQQVHGEIAKRDKGIPRIALRLQELLRAAKRRASRGTITDRADYALVIFSHGTDSASDRRGNTNQPQVGDCPFQSILFLLP